MIAEDVIKIWCVVNVAKNVGNPEVWSVIKENARAEGDSENCGIHEQVVKVAISCPTVMT